jgi:anti-anti-sigma factor
MELNARKEKNIAVISVRGRVDALTSPDFEKHLSELIKGGERLILINFTDLEYISSAGLRSILATAKKLKADQGELLFTGLVGPVAEVFKISGFHTIFRIFEAEADVLAQFAGNP